MTRIYSALCSAFLFGTLGALAVGCGTTGGAGSQSPPAAAAASAAAPLPELLLLDTDKMKDKRGKPGGTIGDGSPWPMFPLPDGTPKDWTGTYDKAVVHARLEVKSKPNANNTSMQYLFWQDKTPGDGNIDMRLEIGGPGFKFTEPGIYFDEGQKGPVASGWGVIHGPFDFTRMHEVYGGIATKALEKEHRAKKGPCVLHRTFKECWPFREHYHPIAYRMIVVAVPPGQTFSGWDKYVGP